VGKLNLTNLTLDLSSLETTIQNNIFYNNIIFSIFITMILLFIIQIVNFFEDKINISIKDLYILNFIANPFLIFLNIIFLIFYLVFIKSYFLLILLIPFIAMFSVYIIIANIGEFLTMVD